MHRWTAPGPSLCGLVVDYGTMWLIIPIAVGTSRDLTRLPLRTCHLVIALSPGFDSRGRLARFHRWWMQNQGGRVPARCVSSLPVHVFSVTRTCLKCVASHDVTFLLSLTWLNHLPQVGFSWGASPLAGSSLQSVVTVLNIRARRPPSSIGCFSQVSSWVMEVEENTFEMSCSALQRKCENFFDNA